MQQVLCILVFFDYNRLSRHPLRILACKECVDLDKTASITEYQIGREERQVLGVLPEVVGDFIELQCNDPEVKKPLR